MSIYISYSRMQSYLGCPYAHYLRYVRRLSKKRPERPLYFGTDFHKLLELRNDPKALKTARTAIMDAYYDMPASWQGDLGENYVDDLFSIFQDYQTVYEGTRQPQVTEQEFELEVGKFRDEPIVFVGKIDEMYLLKRHGEKTIKIGEHKTFTNKPNMDTLVMNPQKCLYAKAVQILRGILPQRVIWDYIKSTPASEPIWLEKSGRFSEAASSKITPMSWKRACESRGITDPAVIARGERYAPNINEFFFKVELDIDPRMVDKVWEGYMFTAKQIIRFGEKNRTQNITKNCSWCSYRDICHAELTGGDPEYIISKDFEERPRKEN